MPFVKVNVNNRMRVRLTEVGRRHHMAKMVGLGLDPVRHAPKEGADGWHEDSIWRIANSFGEAMFNGGTVPFETEVEIDISEREHYDFGLPIKWTRREVPAGAIYPYQVAADQMIGNARLERMLNWCAEHFGVGEANLLLPPPFLFKQDVPGTYLDSNDEPCEGTVVGFSREADLVMFVLAWSGDGVVKS